MNAFSYVARDAGGQIVRASIDAATRSDALHRLKERGMTVVSLHGGETDRTEEISAAKKADRKRGRRISFAISTGDIAVMCRQLSISINAGVAIRDALDSIGEDLENTRLQHVMKDVVNRLHEGANLSAALKPHSRIFSEMFVALIRTAEEAGSLPQTLDNLAGYLERADRLERKIKSITAYPVFVGVFFCLVCVIMTLFVLPQFQDIFSGFDAELPMLTRIVFELNSFLLNHVWYIFGGAGVSIAAMILYGKTEGGRARYDAWKLRIPLFGGWLRKFSVARFCRNLGMMLRGGVPVTTAFELNASVSGNKVLERSLLEARDRIIAGSSISASLAADPEFPRLLVRMAAVGEESGRLPEVMEKLAEVYEDQVEGAILVALALFEPIMIVLFGAVILVLILAIYMPVFSVGASVK